MIIGRRGHVIRQMDSDAQQAIERMIGGKVYLDPWVKVRTGWRQDERKLRRLGFQST